MRDEELKKSNPLPGLSALQVHKLINLAARIAGAGLEPEEAFQDILELGTELTASDQGSIHLFDKTKFELRLAAIRGVPEEPVLGFAYSLDHSLSGMAVQRGLPVVVRDVATDPRYVPLFREVRSELAVPIKVGKEVVGVINLESKQSDHFTEEHARLVELVASLLAAAFRSGELTRLRSELDVLTTQPQTGELVFVLMPFREPFHKYYRTIFKPAVEDAGMRALRSDEIFGPTEIMRDLWGSIHEAQVVLAELTGRNPNVMYEVGLSHGVGKPVILVAQSIEDVPFDLRGLRCILYDTTDPDWGNRLRSDITKSLGATALTVVRGPYHREND